MSQTSNITKRNKLVVLAIQDAYNVNLLPQEKRSIRSAYSDLSDSVVLDLLIKIRFCEITKREALNPSQDQSDSEDLKEYYNRYGHPDEESDNV